MLRRRDARDARLVDALQSNARLLSRIGIGSALPAMGRRDAWRLRSADAGLLPARRLLRHVALLFSDPRLVKGLDRILLVGEFRVGCGYLLLRSPDDVAGGESNGGRGLRLRAVPPDQSISARRGGGVFELHLDTACFVIRRETARRFLAARIAVELRRILRQ